MAYTTSIMPYMFLFNRELCRCLLLLLVLLDGSHVNLVSLSIVRTGVRGYKALLSTRLAAAGVCVAPRDRDARYSEAYQGN